MSCAHHPKMFAFIIYTGLLSIFTDVALSKYIVAPRIPDGMTVHKVIATWSEAQDQCISEGAVLASPINAEMVAAMKMLIGAHNTEYFIGTRAKKYPGPYQSVEGVPLYKMSVVMDMIQQLDPRAGDCLSMDRYNIRVVSCCTRLPYMCYTPKTEPNATTIENIILETTPKAVDKTYKIVLEEAITTEKEITTEEQITTEEEITTEEQVTTEEQEAQTIMVPTQPKQNSSICGTDDYEYVSDLTASCYKKHEERLLWDDAVVACAKEGAHLVVINDDFEAEEIKNMYPMTAWWIHIGHRNYGPDDGWRDLNGVNETLYDTWIDGTGFKSPLFCCGLLKFTGEMDWDTCSTGIHPFLCERPLS